MRGVERPEREIDAATVKQLANYAGLPVDDGHAQQLANFLHEHLAAVRSWEQIVLGFDFASGRHPAVRPSMTNRVPWSLWSQDHAASIDAIDDGGDGRAG